MYLLKTNIFSGTKNIGQMPVWFGLHFSTVCGTWVMTWQT